MARCDALYRGVIAVSQLLAAPIIIDDGGIGARRERHAKYSCYAWRPLKCCWRQALRHIMHFIAKPKAKLIICSSLLRRAKLSVSRGESAASDGNDFSPACPKQSYSLPALASAQNCQHREIYQHHSNWKSVRPLESYHGEVTDNTPTDHIYRKPVSPETT